MKTFLSKCGAVAMGKRSLQGDIQGQDLWGSEQTILVKDVPTYSRRVGLDDF